MQEVITMYQDYTKAFIISFVLMVIFGFISFLFNKKQLILSRISFIMSCISLAMTIVIGFCINVNQSQTVVHNYKSALVNGPGDDSRYKDTESYIKSDGTFCHIDKFQVKKTGFLNLKQEAMLTATCKK